jgi:hypothetical protein
MTKNIQLPRVLLEAVVIVGSILLAFGIDDWWDGVQDRRDEYEALAGFRADLRTDSADLHNTRNQLARYDERAAWINRRVGVATPTDSAEAAVRSMFFFSLYQPVRTTYVGLRDSGQVGLLSDQDLRRDLINYYEVSQPYMLQFHALLASLHQQVVDAALEVGDLVPEADATTLHSPPYRLNRPWHSIPRESEFVDEVLYRAATAAQWAIRIDSVLEDIGGMLRRLDSVVSEDP